MLSISASVVSSKVFGMAVPALFTNTSRLPNVATVFSTAALTALASAASAWIAIALPPAASMAFTTDAAASAPFEYVIATFAPSAARRFAIAAPMPRDAPVTSATLLLSLDMGSPMVFLWLGSHRMDMTLRRKLRTRQTRTSHSLIAHLSQS